MKKPFPYRLRGSTLIEVLVAMTLVSIIFVIGSQTVLQVNGIQAPYREQGHRLRARTIIQEVEVGHEVPDVIHFESVYFVTEVKPSEHNSRLLQVDVDCFDHQDQLLFSRHKIIRRHES